MSAQPQDFLAAPLPDHWQGLGLQRDPFAEPVDDALYFDEPARMQQLRVLHHLAQYTNLILYVQGPRGAGKTTLIEHFLTQVSSDWRVCRVEAHEFLEETRLLEIMGRTYRLADDGSAADALLDGLREQWASLGESGLVPVLVVDNAELLPPATLKLIAALSATAEPDGTVLHTILVGEGLTGAQTKAVSEVLGEGDPFKHIDIPPLFEEQTRDYLFHRLAAAGYEMPGPFTAQTVRRLHRESMGLPGRINRLAREELDRFARAHSNEPLPRPASAAASNAILKVTALSLLAVVVVGLFAFWQNGRDLAPAADGTAAANGTRTEALALPAAEPRPEPAIAVDTGVIARPASPAADQAATVADEPEPAAEKAAQPVTAASATADAAPEAPETAPEAPASPEAATGLKGPDWLQSQSPDDFTLQLLGTRQEDALRRFARDHGLTDEAAYFQTRRDGRPWYGLVLGVYPSRTAAQTAAGKLPPKLANPRPWIRQMAEVQADIRRQAAP